MTTLANASPVVADLSADVAVPFEKPWGNYLLEKLIETPPPEAISWLPATPGWWALALIIVILLSVQGYKLYRRYKANAYRREALSWLQHSTRQHDSACVAQIPALLKKVAMAAYGREDVAALSGSDWEAWLDSQCEHSQFVTQCPDFLARLSYRQAVSLNSNECELLLKQTRLWIGKHRSCND